MAALFLSQLYDLSKKGLRFAKITIEGDKSDYKKVRILNILNEIIKNTSTS